MSAYLGEFEQLVLLAVLRLDRSATAAAVRSSVEEATARKTWIGAVYTTLDRLAAKGLVRSSIVELKEEGGQRRKVFALTPAGEKAIRNAYATWQRATKGLKFRFES
jgi:PadR family transcriptional regulator, regulatory protein PadR